MRHRYAALSASPWLAIWCLFVMIRTKMKNVIWITPCHEYARAWRSKKEVVVKKRHFHPIFSHWFQFSCQITTHNCFFLNDLKTRNDLRVAPGMRILMVKKTELIWFSFHFLMFKRFFSTHNYWANTTPPIVSRHSSPSGFHFSWS